jgi:hypothetical protein
MGQVQLLGGKLRPAAQRHRSRRAPDAGHRASLGPKRTLEETRRQQLGPPLPRALQPRDIDALHAINSSVPL